MSDILQQFRDAMATHGIVPPGEIVADGRIHRCDAEGKPGKDDAAYLLYPDRNGGWFQNWRSDQDWQDWRAKTDRALTPGEEAEYRTQINAARKEREAEDAKRREEARERANFIWENAQKCTEHEYLTRKGVRPYLVRLHEDRLVIPMLDANMEVHSVQFIAADGTKRFLLGGRKKGCYFGIGTPNGVLCIAEGYATAASIHEATGYAVAVAFDAGNLEPVAKALREKMPDIRIVLCADDDYKTTGNPGITKAKEAAAAVSCIVAVPVFGESRPDGATDFNDLHQAQGLEAVKRCIKAALTNEAVESVQPRPETDGETVKWLASLPLLEYDRVRKNEAKRMGVRESTLDKMVTQERQVQHVTDGIEFDDVEQWHDPVAGDVLLSDIAASIQRFIVCKPETAYAAALWVAMTWLIDTVQVAPLAVITAPEKRCGKSQLLTFLGKLSHRPIQASSISTAALYRVIEAWKPTLMVDEADAFMRENDELRGILNSGHTRDSAHVIRTVGDDHTPKKFSTWGAKAIAGIGKLADTLMDRSIILDLRRKLPHENVERLRYAEPGLFDDLVSKLCRWADDSREAVRRARPELPQVLNDRAQDNWEPLLAIADVAGGAWPDMARKAAVTISGGDDESASIGNELLADIREVFDTKHADRIWLSELVTFLCDDDERRWSTYNRGGKPITTRQLSARLRGYGIEPKSIRIGGVYGDSKKGYERNEFNDAFSRYLSYPPPSVTRSHLNNGAGFGVTEKNYVSHMTEIQSRDRSENPFSHKKPSIGAGCDRVTGEKGDTGDEEIEVTI